MQLTPIKNYSLARIVYLGAEFAILVSEAGNEALLVMALDCGRRIAIGGTDPCFDEDEPVRLVSQDNNRQLVVFAERMDDVPNAPWFITRWGFRDEFDTAKRLLGKGPGLTQRLELGKVLDSVGQAVA